MLGQGLSLHFVTKFGEIRRGLDFTTNLLEAEGIGDDQEAGIHLSGR